MTRSLVLASLVIASVAVAQDASPVRVELRGTSRSGRIPVGALRLHASATGLRVTVVAERWSEGCTDSSAPPAFHARVVGRRIVLERDGASSAPRCEEGPHVDRFCAGPDGEMMDCPRRVCLCLYDVTAEVSVPAPGAYQVVALDGRRTRGRARVLAEAQGASTP